jgi:Holliday junction resolvase RusA-like endonuclease
VTDTLFSPETPGVGAPARPGTRPPTEEEAMGGRPAIVITVYGTPAPQGSKHGRPVYKGRGDARAFTGKVAQVESSKKVKPWREAVKQAALDLVMVAGDTGRLAAGFPLDGALLVEFAFTFARPKGHYRTGGNAHLLRDSAPAYPTVYPDLSKLIRSTEDACTDAGVWADDARIVRYRDPRKVYAGSADPDALHAPGAVIRVWEVS